MKTWGIFFWSRPVSTDEWYPTTYKVSAETRDNALIMFGREFSYAYEVRIVTIDVSPEV